MTASTKSHSDLLKRLGLLIAVLMLPGVMFLFPLDIASRDVQMVLGVFLTTIVLWITKPVPYTVSSLLSVILLYAFNLVPTFEDAVSGYASNLVFFMIILLVVGESISKVELDKWIANFLVSSTTTPKGSVRRLSSTMLLLALIMPSGTARTVAFMPIIDQTNAVYSLEEDSQFRRLAYYVVGHLNPVGSLTLMTGGGASITIAGLIDSLVQPITWVEWLVYMGPPILLIFVLGVTCVSLVYDVDDDLHAAQDMRPANNESQESKTAPLTREQKFVIGTLIGAIVFWVLGSFVGIPTIIPAMVVVVAFSLPRIEVITASEIRSINWGIIFLLGTMLSLLDAMRAMGAFDLIINLLTSVLPMEASQPVILVILFVAAILVRGVFSSIGAAYIILFPILLEFVLLIGANPLYFALALPIVLMSTTFLPFNIPTVLISYERGPLDIREVFFLGLLTMVLGGGIAVLSWGFYWPLVDGISAVFVR